MFKLLKVLACLQAVVLAAGEQAVCRIYGDPFLRPFNSGEEYALNSEILPPGIYDIASNIAPCEVEGPQFKVQLIIGEPFLRNGVGCGWNPNTAILTFPETQTVFYLTKDYHAYLKVGTGAQEVLNPPYETQIGETRVTIEFEERGDDRYLTLKAFLPWELTIGVKGWIWEEVRWGRVFVYTPEDIGPHLCGLCNVDPDDLPPTTCDDEMSRKKRQSAGLLKGPEKEDVMRWKLRARRSDCDRLSGAKKWACKSRNREKRNVHLEDFEELPAHLYPPMPDVNMTNMIEIYSRNRRHSYSFENDYFTIRTVCNRVKDRNGPFRNCVFNTRFNAQNQFNLCVTMLNGMGTDKNSVCTVMSQIASNCVDLKGRYVHIPWKSVMRC